jgi:hypothetical protein
VFALVPLVHLPLSRLRILLIVSPPVYREPPGVSAIEDLILPKALNCSQILPIGYFLCSGDLSRTWIVRQCRVRVIHVRKLPWGWSPSRARIRNCHMFFETSFSNAHETGKSVASHSSRASGWSCCSGVGARTFNNGASCGGYLSGDERACKPSGLTACYGRVVFLRRRLRSSSSIMTTIPGTKHPCNIRCAGQLVILQPRSRRSTLSCAATLRNGLS